MTMAHRSSVVMKMISEGRFTILEMDLQNLLRSEELLVISLKIWPTAFYSNKTSEQDFCELWLLKKYSIRFFVESKINTAADK